MSNARPWSSLRSFANLSRLTRLHFTVLLTLVASLASGAAASDAHAQGISFTPTWTQLTSASAETPGADLAYDAATGQVVLFGGADGSTWIWNSTAWTQQSPATSPPARGGASMAYDAATGQVVLFGGSNGSNLLNDTWTWNGTTWTQQQLNLATIPQPRVGASMAYDAANGQVVLFGGEGVLEGPPGSQYLNDTWTWNGTAWTQQSTVAGQGGREGASMAYDAATGQVVLFGGLYFQPYRDGGGSLAVLGDTWTWNGTTWTQQSPASSPSARSGAGMAYDAATGQVVLFGGGNALNDTWTWNGTAWTQQSPANNPPTGFSELAYDAATGQFILFGGYANNSYLNETWQLQLGLTNFGSANVCPSPQTTPVPCSQTQTVNFTVGASPVTLVDINLVTQGTPTPDYTLNSTTCTPALAANATCTATVNFAPQYPGQRFGGIAFISNTGALLGSSLFNGTGEGPLAVTLPGTISTVAGNGTQGYSGDGGAATSAALYQPVGVAVDGAGNLYFSDSGNDRIRKVTAATGAISTVAGNGSYGYSGDGGTATSAQLGDPEDVAMDGAGNLYIADTYNNRIRKVTAATGVISTVAGNGSYGYYGDGGAATSAELENPCSVAVDAAGNLYIADQYNNRIRMVTVATGVISTVAGTGTPGFSGDGGAAASAWLNNPTDVVVDASGNLYIADLGNSRIREVTAATGTISTIAGNGTFRYSGDGGPATSAGIDVPEYVVLDAAGDLYIPDGLSNRVREVTAATGVISTVVGNGTSGYSGNGGAATSAELSFPNDVAVDGAGNLYISDNGNNRIRKVTATAAPVVYPTATKDGATDTTDGTQTVTLANIGNQPLSIAVPYSGYNPSVGLDFTLTTSGLAACPQLNTSSSAATLGDGASCTLPLTFTPISQSNGLRSESLTVTDNSLNLPNATQTVALSGTALATATTTTVVSSPNPAVYGQAVTFTATVSSSVGPPPDGEGVLFAFSPYPGNSEQPVYFERTLSGGTASVTLSAPPGIDIMAATYDGDSNFLGSIGSGGVTVNIATPTFSVAAGTYTSPQLVTITSASTGVPIYFTTDGSTPTPGSFTTPASPLYTAPIAVTSSETINAIAVSNVGYGNNGPINVSSGVASAAYVLNNVVGVISTVAGNGTQGYSGDGGTATTAELSAPNGVAVDSSGNIYIVDRQNQRIREVTPAGVISTVAGDGTGGYGGDGGAATSAELALPRDVAVDSGGNLYVADTNNSRIRKVTATTGVISTVAGNGTSGYSGDGSAATSAEIATPFGVAVDSSGNLYIADTYNQRIRKVTPAGVISTVAGNGIASYSGDGGAATSAELAYPEGVVVDSSGNLYIADTANNRVRKVTPAGVISTVAGNGTGSYSGDGGTATSAELYSPTSVAVDSSGNLYIADDQNHRIREVNPAGVISTVAGNGTGGYNGDGGPATSAELFLPSGVAVDSSGNVYVADDLNQRIRKVTYGSSAPVISNLQAITVGGNSEVITWTTDQPSTSQVNYGATSSYGSSSTLNTALVTSHSVTLSNLKANTTYDFDVVSTNATSGTATSPNSTFATTPNVGYVAFWGVNNTGITISWSTDVPATTFVAYGTTTALGQLSPVQTTLTQSHGVVLTGLISGTTYYFVAESTTAGGSTGNSTVYSFTTTGTAPAGPPVISNVAVSSITNTSATITWTTDQASSSLVNFGTTTSYGSSSTLNATLVTSHSVTLTGLTLGTTYDFNVVSANAGAMSSTSGNSTFMTTSVVSSPPVITSVATTNLTSTSVTVTWTTDQPSSSLVNYGTTMGYGSSSTLNTTLVTSHSVTLTGLAASTTYDFDVVSANAAAQSTTSPNSTFSTLASTATPPQVGYVDFWGINNTGITISWSTDVFANTQLAYGTTTALGQLSSLQTALTQSHGVVLTTLNPGTTYYFVAQSTGANGATGYSTTYSFTTTGTAPAGPPVISNVMATNITNTSATITWTTDQASSSLVNFGTTNGYGSSSTLDTTLVTSHSVTLTGLTLGTTYDFDVVSANAGAMSAASGNSTFMTTSVVSSPPVITNVATTNPTSTSVTVTWTTDQPSSSLVNYGTTMGYGSSSTLNTTLVTSHSVTLSGLAASTAYDFDVVSANAAAQSTTSPNSTFSTLASTATPPQVGYVVAWGVNNSNATVTWSTDVFANTQLAYGTTMALGQLSPLQTAMTQSHGVVLSGLISGTTYYYQAQSTGANGATGYSTVMSFTTTGTAPAGPPVISNVLVSNVTNTSATITWTTDQASSSLVNFGTTNGYGSSSTLDTTLVTSHSVTLTGLTLGTTYDFDVVSANAGAMSATSGNSTFMTTSVVSSPPVITNVATTNLTSTSVTMTWTTDQPSSSLVNYGTTMSYGSSSTLNTTLVTSHSVTLSGLAASTAYDFDVVSANAAAQSTTSPNSTFSTLASTATPPQVGYVDFWGVNNTGITISWSTDVLASTQLAYGTTTSLGQLSPLQTALTQSHGVVLTTLNPGTTYYFVAQSTGANGATGYSTTYSFTTTGTQTTPPPVISNVVATSVSNTSETITWTTDQSASSQVSYGATTTYSNSTTLDPTLVTSHSVTLTGLTPGTAYDFDVMSANSLALSSTSTNSSFTTTGTAPAPVITNVGSSGVTSGTATITWTTDQASTSVVNYGTTTGYGSSASSAGLVTTHSVILTGLSPNTTYNFDVVSANAANTSSTSTNYTFKTSSNTAPPPVISYLDFWGITSSGVTISWSTNEPATTAVAYGTTNALGLLSPVQTALTISHGVILTGLAAGTTYYFAAQSADGSGNTGYSTTFSFTTLPGPPTISNVTTNPAANNKATISWTTSVPTYSYVQFGTAAGVYNAYSAQTALTATPQCSLQYVPSGTIHYQLVSTDAYGNQVVTPDATFVEP